MSEIARLEERLNEVEIKLSFTEDLVDRLNEIIVRQQAQIELLIKEVVQLRDQGPASDSGLLRQVLDEKPPHY